MCGLKTASTLPLTTITVDLKTEPSRGGYDSCIQAMWLQNPSTLSPLYPAIGFSTVDQPRPTGLEGGLLQQQHYHCDRCTASKHYNQEINLVIMFSKHFGQSFTSGGRLPTTK